MDNGQLSAKENVLKDKSYSFALAVARIILELQDKKKEYVLSKQVLRSATSVGANIEEANQAESKADFIHKLSIANKEANETHYWLRLLIDTKLLSEEKGRKLLHQCVELLRILTASSKLLNQKNNCPLSIVN